MLCVFMRLHEGSLIFQVQCSFESQLVRTYRVKMDRKSTRCNHIHTCKSPAKETVLQEPWKIKFCQHVSKKVALEQIIVYHATHDYRFINFISVFAAISQMVIFQECKKDVQFSETKNRRLGFKIAITFDCGVKTVIMS